MGRCAVAWHWEGGRERDVARADAILCGRRAIARADEREGRSGRSMRRKSSFCFSRSRLVFF